MQMPYISRRQLSILGASAVLAGICKPLAFAQNLIPTTTSQTGETPMTQASKTVTLPDGSRVPALGLGSWRLAAGRHSLAQEEHALRTGISLGMCLLDTAEYYSSGAAEQLIGRVISGQRDQVFVVSKIMPMNADSARSIRRSCENSLRNLKTDYMDLYLLHWRGGEDLPLMVNTFEQLKSEEKIRHWGVSNFGVSDMEELFRLPHGKNCATNQVRYSLSDRSMEVNGMIQWSLEHTMPFMTYSPLGSGGGLLRHPVLADIARKHNTGPAAVAVAWTLRNGNIMSIPESGRAEHIRENATAATLVLDESDLVKLDTAFPAKKISHWSGT